LNGDNVNHPALDLQKNTNKSELKGLLMQQ